MKTKAVRLYGESDLRLEEFELPEIDETQILIKVISDSVCMSTYKTAMQGAKHLRVPNDVHDHPVIVGHEFCAQIEKVGKKWEHAYAVGEKVIIPPVLSYLPNNATIGYTFQTIGGDSTYSVVENHVIENGFLLKLNSNAFFKGSLIEPSSCVIRGFKETFHTDEEGNHFLGLKENGKTAILAGCGPMGLEAIDIALSGYRKISLLVVTDLDESRLKRAESLFQEKAEKNGVKLIFSTASSPEELNKLSGGTGFDDVFVYAPVPALIELADQILAFDGCLNFFAGPIDKTLSAKFNFYNVHYAKHHVAGTSGSTPTDMKDIVDLIGEEKIDPAIMITHIGGLDAVIDTTLRLPKIPGGKKLIYTHITMPLTAIADFAKLGETDARFETLSSLVKENNGVWSSKAEEFLLNNF